MELWQELLRKSVDSGKDLVNRFGFDEKLANQLNKLFHIFIKGTSNQTYALKGFDSNFCWLSIGS